jgi:hypothetical protein
MKRLAPILAALFLTFAVVVPSAQAAFGLREFDVAFTEKDGSPVTQAGSHPFAMITTVHLNTMAHPQHPASVVPDGEIKDLNIKLPPGFAGNPSATPACQTADFLSLDPVTETPACPDSTAVGTVRPEIVNPGYAKTRAVFNLTPPPGVISKIGFVVLTVPVTIEIGLNPNPPYNVVPKLPNIPQPVSFFGSELTLWGTPADPAHDPDRGSCVAYPDRTCSVSLPQVPFLDMPTSCNGPLVTRYEADSWQNPGPFLADGEPDLSNPAWVSGVSETHYKTEPPIPLGTSGCASLPFKPTITAKPTTRAASSPTGLDFSLDVHDEGLNSPTGIANSTIKKTVVTLPEGFSVNASIAEGLEVCTPAQVARETAFSEAGAGCPNASKIGTVEVESELLEENVNGSLFQAAPYDNPFNSLIALYVVIKNPTLGIKVTQPLKVETDPVTGRLTTVAEDMPQLPFSHFKLHFREGARSPLASPSKCGTYNASATLYPWSGTAPVTTTSAFQIITGPDAGSCPSGGLPPFKPGLIAGSINNAAGRFSPFNIRLSRTDSEQEITHFSIKLPPGITAKLAGIPYCSDAQIAAATARTGPHGGQEELTNPSCPAASEVGRTLVGSGVGSALAYAPGKIYLAGPYHGSNLSIVAITAGVVGPFDIGTVVVRTALKIDPETAEAFIDATGSDPIPHIIKGIPVHLRDIRVYTDRPNFVLNPTDCTRTSTASTVLGSGLDFGSEADDRPVTVSTPYQAADCAALPFKPRLGLKLIGGTKRGSHPAFKATLKMNGIGEAGIARAEVTLPKSEFIENAHFNTICTRVQFKAGAGNGANCPAGSIYGKARAVTPILGEPLTGPVFLRSSEHQLPDLVVALHNSQVDFDLVGHVDSVKGRLRNTFEAAPDAPVSSFVLEMKGGKKGLFVNSTNLCKGTHRAEANFDGQNGKSYDTKPELKVKCKGKAKKGKGKAKQRRAN